MMPAATDTLSEPMFPTKGMPAPFISYGGSNMVCSLVATGFLVSIALDSWIPDYAEKFQLQLNMLFMNMK